MKKNLLLWLGLSASVFSCQDQELTSSPQQGKINANTNSPSLALKSVCNYAPEELYINYNDYQVRAIDQTSGSGYVYYPDNALLSHMASTNGYIFGIMGSNLVKSDPALCPSFTPFGPYGTGWNGTEAMTALGGYLYAVQGGTLWKVNATTGSVTTLGSGAWNGTEAMTAIGSYVYAVEGGTLWKVHTTTGAITTLGTGDWTGTEAMTAYGSYIYAIQGGILWRVDISNGSISTFGTGGWSNTAAMTALNGYVYAVQGGALWKVNLSNASIVQLGTITWNYVNSMTARY